MLDASCRNKPQSWFFASKGNNAAVAAAKSVCRTCPVREKCLEYAIENCIRFGIWGGKTVRERVIIKRERVSNG